MITFFDRMAIYDPPEASRLSRAHPTGSYNKLVLERVDESLVGVASPEVYLETASCPAANSWIRVGDAIPVGISTRTGLGPWIRVSVAMAATADSWYNGIPYNVDELVQNMGNVWICIQSHVANQDNEPEGTNGTAANWANSTAYSVGNLVKGADGLVYYCKQAHTSSLNDQPPTGANWQTYWQLNYELYWADYQADLYAQVTVYGKLVQS